MVPRLLESFLRQAYPTADMAQALNISLDSGFWEDLEMLMEEQRLADLELFDRISAARMR